jgi:hypothetical protein
MITKNRYHPRIQVTNVKAPPATWQLYAIEALPFAAFIYEPPRQPKEAVSVKKMLTNMALVRRAKIM